MYKHKLIKILILLILIITPIIVFSIIMSSCSGDKQSANVIRFWHFWSEPNQKEALTKLITQFEQENNCKVELTELSWNDGKTKLMAAFNSKVAPDVLELGSDWVTQFSSTNTLMLLEPDSVNINNFLEVSLQAAIWNGKIYALPWIVDTRVLFYNKDLMLASDLDTIPPQDYSQLIEMANIINNPIKNIYGFGTNGSDPHRLYKKILPMFWTFGGNIFDDNGNPILNSVSNIEALRTYVQLSRAGIIETQRQIDANFAQGKVGFAISGAWLMKKIETTNPAMQYGVALMPRYLLNQGISFLGAEYLAINSNTRNKDLALKLITFLTSGKNSLELAKHFDEAGFPADKKYFNDDFFAKHHNKKVFAHQLVYAKPTPLHTKWLDIEAILEEAVTEAIYGTKSEMQALNDAQVKILKMFNE